MLIKVPMTEEKPIIFESSPEIDIRRILRVIVRYKWFILTTTGGITFIAFLFLLITAKMDPAKSPFPDVYRPAALLLLNEKGGGNSLASLQNLSFLGNNLGLSSSLTGSFSYGELAVRLLRSNTMLDTIAAEFELSHRYGFRNNPVGRTRREMLRHLHAEYDEKTMLISLGYEDYDPEFTARITNRFVELLDKRFLSIGGNTNTTRKNLLESNLREVNSRIAVFEASLQQFQKQYGVLDIESLAMEQVSVMADLRSRLILAEMEMKTYKNFSTIHDPVYKRLNAERNNLAELIREMESGYSEYNQVFPDQTDLSELALRYYRLQRDLKVQEKIYEVLSQQYELLKLSLESGEPVFQVLERAIEPDLKLKPGRSMLCLLAAAGACLLSLAIVFPLHSFSRDPTGRSKE